jgi:hypothetical protein
MAALLSGARAERTTLGLAVFGLGPAFALIGGELMRMARRRRESGTAETPDNLVESAGYATRDTFAVARRGIQATPHHETVLFNLLQGFLGAFAIARISTWGIRSGWWPFENVSVSGRHIHHFIPGIVIAFASGLGAITTRNEGVEAALAIPFGVGMGLTMDEAALLLDLEDVYWTRQGLLSVQVLRRGEEKGVEEGLIPAYLGEHGMRATGALA